MAPVGPQLPSSSTPDKRKRHEEEEDSGTSSDSDSDIGPAPPITEASEPAPKKARVIGPSLPPPSHNDNSGNDSDGDSSDSDDDFGPNLPANSTRSPETPTDATPSIRSQVSTGTSNSQPKRDDWMLVPPAGGDWTARVDPTKLKNRRFNTGKGAKGPPSSSRGPSATDSWHETPQEKQARLQREIMGIKEVKQSAAEPSPQSSANDRDTAKRLEEYHKSRGPSMYEARQKDNQSVDQKDDDPSARAFDRDKDIGGGIQINATRRRELLKKASDFNTRFSSAKYL